MVLIDKVILCAYISALTVLCGWRPVLSDRGGAGPAQGADAVRRDPQRAQQRPLRQEGAAEDDESARGGGGARAEAAAGATELPELHAGAHRRRGRGRLGEELPRLGRQREVHLCGSPHGQEGRGQVQLSQRNRPARHVSYLVLDDAFHELSMKSLIRFCVVFLFQWQYGPRSGFNLSADHAAYVRGADRRHGGHREGPRAPGRRGAGLGRAAGRHERQDGRAVGGRGRRSCW